MWETCFPRFHVSTSEREGESYPPLITFMTDKFKNCIATAEIMINYAETIIDLATELQYLLIEQEGVKQDKQSHTPEKMSELRLHRGKEERSQISEEEVGTSVDVQKLYLPVFRLSTKNVCAKSSIEKQKTQRKQPTDNQLTTN